MPFACSRSTAAIARGVNFLSCVTQRAVDIGDDEGNASHAFSPARGVMMSTPSSEATIDGRAASEKQPVLDHPDRRVDRLLQLPRLRDRAERAVEDEIAAVGDEGAAIALPQFGPCPEFFERCRRGLPAELNDFDRDRKTLAEPIDELLVIDHDDEALACRRDDLLAQQRAAMPLDQVEGAALDLVGAVDREIDAAMLAECRERNAEPARHLGGVLRGRDRDDRQALRDASAPAPRRRRRPSSRCRGRAPCRSRRIRRRARRRRASAGHAREGRSFRFSTAGLASNCGSRRSPRRNRAPRTRPSRRRSPWRRPRSPARHCRRRSRHRPR